MNIERGWGDEPPTERTAYIPAGDSRTYDLVVVGSGIAGLYAALLAAPEMRVLLVTKGALEESNTRYAQGGIAAAIGPRDSPELHLRDTIAAGDGLCDVPAVRALTREAPDCILDLLHLGVPFDRNGEELAWTLEAAHSLPRVLHAGGDATGAGIERTLASALRDAGVTIRESALCTGLHAPHGRVRGVDLLLVDGSQVRIEAPHVLLASGGAGQLFARTTNPSVATGDGMAIAYRAGAQLMDLEFVQFHPTALKLEGAPSFLISEAVRGEGGVLRDASGRAFMADYHQDRELAPRDVVARAIHRQMVRTGADHVWLDVTHLPTELVENRFPSIVRFCRVHCIDPVRQPIPVSPAAHYMMGGIRTDVWGRTSVPGLMACGEAACTGAHGANRLASNSLLEGLVFARRVAACLLSGRGDETPEWSRAWTPASGLQPLLESGLSASFRPALRHIMWEHASLVRSESSLRTARAALEQAAEQTDTRPGDTRDDHETRNLRLLAHLVLQSAEAREESRGAHFRSDFAHSEPAWRRHSVISRDGMGTVEVAGAEAGAGVIHA